MTESGPVAELEYEDLNAAVAEEVMGWHSHYSQSDQQWWTDEDGRKLYRQEDWRPSTDMEDAWVVQEKLQGDDWSLSVESRVAVVGEAERASGPAWIVRCVDAESGTEITEGGDSAPEAVSRAALRVARAE